MARRVKTPDVPTSGWQQRLSDSIFRRDSLLFALSVGTALLLFLLSRDVGLLAYHNSVIKVVDATRLEGGLTLLHNGQAIDGDVYAVETTLANLGTIPFDESRVRRPVEIAFQKGARVREAWIGKASDPDIAHFTLKQETDSSLKLTWKTFDPNQYVKVTSLVSASEPVETHVGATILGVDIFAGRPEPKGGRWVEVVLVTLANGAVLAIAGATLVSLIFSVRELRSKRFLSGLLLLLVVLGLAYGVYIVAKDAYPTYYTSYLEGKPIVPF